jgi:hypothetical protein
MIIGTHIWTILMHIPILMHIHMPVLMHILMMHILMHIPIHICSTYTYSMNVFYVTFDENCVMIFQVLSFLFFLLSITGSAEPNSEFPDFSIACFALVSMFS